MSAAFSGKEATANYICAYVRGVLPLGFAENFGSGKLRKIIHESTGAAETYLAHQLPDQYNAIATPVGLLVLLLAFDWRLGLLSLAPVVLAFLIMATMTGKRMAEKMRQCGNALESMSNEAVEYVRGIPVVKTFGQSVFSLKKFKATIDEYEKWGVSYTKDLRLPMMFYTAAVNGMFAFLIAGGLLFTPHGVTAEFLLNLLFYIIITPVISLTLTRMMYMSESKMVVADALARIDSVLEEAPMQVQAVPQHPQDASVTLQDVHFSYDGKTEVIKGVSLDIQPGQIVAFVGPSGGGKSTLANLVCRFFDVQSGSVRVGGADVRDIPKKEPINAIYLYDDKALITFNYKEGTETVAFGKAVKAEKSSDMSVRGEPNFKRQIVRFGFFPLRRKAAAHFLHTVCTFARIGGFSAQGLHSLLSFAKKWNLSGRGPSILLCKTVLSLKSPTGAFIAPLRCANANF